MRKKICVFAEKGFVPSIIQKCKKKDHSCLNIPAPTTGTGWSTLTTNIPRKGSDPFAVSRISLTQRPKSTDHPNFWNR